MDYGGTVEGRFAPAPEHQPARLAEAAIAPPARDPMWFSPLFVLSPARSNSSVVTAMLGQHPGLCVFPELALFRKDTVDALLSDPPGWRGPPTRLRLAGVFRALAEHHDDEQTPDTIEAAVSWVEARRDWSVGDLLDHLLALAAPRIGVEKSPESSSREEYLTRMSGTYPRARYLHLTRHPVPSAASMHRAWEDKGYWNVRPDLFHHFCLAVWYHQHTRIVEFASSLPPDRVLRIRSEDVLNAPAETLPRICRWLGLEAGEAEIEAMTHPERSPYARTGPQGAAGGWDQGFMLEPSLRRTELPVSLDLPAEWNVDPWLALAGRELASLLGYGRS